MIELYDFLAATAAGDAGREAAVDLLNRHGRWLPTLDEHGWISWSTPEDGNNGTYAIIRWGAVATVIETDWWDRQGNYRSRGPSENERVLLVGSSTETQVLLLACSLAVDTRVSVRETLSGLDVRNTRLALHAIAHAARGSDYAEQLVPLARVDDPVLCADCGRQGEVKDWMPSGDATKRIAVCMACGNSWIVPADKEQV